MKQLQETDAQQLVQALDREIRSRGRGAIRAVERAAGYSEGWWQHRSASGDISIQQLLKVLSHLGLDPVGFVRGTLGRHDELELNQPHGQPPPIVQRALNRYESGEEGTGIGHKFINTLDERRYHEPKEVIHQAHWAVDHVELDLFPAFLGVVGSAWRLLMQFNAADHSIQAGITIATRQGSHHTVGQLLQRLSYIVADQGSRTEALRLSEKAAVLFLRSGHLEDVGKAVVDQGIWLHYLNRFDESIETHKSALNQLAPSAHRNRCTAFQYLGLNHRELAQPDQALRYLEKAEQVATDAGIGAWATSKLMWLRARIYSDIGNLSQAEELLLAIVDNFRSLHLGETALATCELVQVYLKLHRPEDAYLAATSMRALVEPLKTNKIISAAIGDLLRSGQTGLTLTLTKQVIIHIEDERQQNKKQWQMMIPRS